MWIYSLMLITTYLWLFSGKKYFSNPLLLAFYFSYISIFIGLGDMIGGYDRYIYGAMFDNIADTVRSDTNVLTMLYYVRGNEYVYFLWEAIVAHITANRYVFILFTTCLTYLLYYRSFKNYISNYPIACFVFLGFFVFFTMTYLRQTLACGIVWQSFKYIIQKKPIPFFILVLIAYGIHNSALVFAPLYFVPQKKYSKKEIIQFLIICFILGLTPFASWAVSTAGDVTSSTARTNSYADEMGGYQIWYVIEAIVFVVFIFKNYHKISYTETNILFVNMTFIFCGILLAFVRFGQGGRFGWYYFFGLVYTFSYIYSVKKPLIWVRPFILLLFSILFFRVLSSWAFNLTPYKTFFEPGYPCGEFYIYQDNEYDEYYTMDKLYRPFFDFK